MNLRNFLIVFLLPIISCHQQENKIPVSDSPKAIVVDTSRCDCKFNYLWMKESDYNSGRSICARFILPEGFVRTGTEKNNFGKWINGLPLLPDGAAVHLYNGELKGYQGAHAAVIDLDVPNQDLQQGIYAIIRLRSEYLFATKQFDSIVFPAINGMKISYATYEKGRRMIIQGNTISENYYGKKYTDPSDHNVLSLYLDDVFRCAQDSLLNSQLISVTPDSMQVGDLFLHVGNPGHAVIVVDMAVNVKTGEKIFMLAQSYRPAQQMHVLKNDYNKNISPWYPLHPKSKLITPEYVFDWGELKRF